MDVQCAMWWQLNKVMKKNGVFHPNFMANCAHANWNTKQIVYSDDDPNEPMADKEHTCYFH